MTAWTAKSATVTGERSSLVSAPVDHFPLNAAGQQRGLADGLDGELGFRRIKHGISMRAGFAGRHAVVRQDSLTCHRESYPARTRTWNEGIKIPSVTITLPGKA